MSIATLTAKPHKIKSRSLSRPHNYGSYAPFSKPASSNSHMLLGVSASRHPRACVSASTLVSAKSIVNHWQRVVRITGRVMPRLYNAYFNSTFNTCDVQRCAQ
eukprot:2720736-Amphidinium_carterae.1